MRLSIIIAGLACFFALTSARAESVSLCNETSYFLEISTAYADGGASRSEGWTTLAPGMCEDKFGNRPDDAAGYVYAVSHQAHAGKGIEFTGRERFCVANVGETFQLDGRRECRNRGFVGVDFAAIDLRSSQPIVTFTEPEGFEKKRAVIAGIQRALRDIGYDISLIDGFSGRQTTEAIEDFARNSKFTDTNNQRRLLDELFKQAKKKSATRGLRFCNQTDYLVWAAAGYLTPTGVASKGWIRVPAKSCSVAINETLNDRYYFTYAEAVTAEGAIVLEAGGQKIWGGTHNMCIKTTRFNIDGNENCVARGFQEAGFARIDLSDQKSWTVTLE
jgi:uncharacterized membrane protein